MWRLLFLIGLLFVGTSPGPLAAQEWSGTAALGLSGGYQTNLYLDPVLGRWNSGVESPFLAVTPQLGLTREASRTRVDLTVRGRVHSRRAAAPHLTQTILRLRRRLHPRWTLGLGIGGSRYRYPALQEGARTARDSWWALPALRWTPTPTTMLSLRTGLTQGFERLPTLTDRQTSGLVSLRATHWLSDRVQGAARHIPRHTESRPREAKCDVGDDRAGDDERQRLDRQGREQRGSGDGSGRPGQAEPQRKAVGQMRVTEMPELPDVHDEAWRGHDDDGEAHVEEGGHHRDRDHRRPGARRALHEPTQRECREDHRDGGKVECRVGSGHRAQGSIWCKRDRIAGAVRCWPSAVRATSFDSVISVPSRLGGSIDGARSRTQSAPCRERKATGGCDP